MIGRRKAQQYEPLDVTTARRLAGEHFDRARGEPDPVRERDDRVERALFLEYVAERAARLDGEGAAMRKIILGQLYLEHLEAIGVVQKGGY